MHSNPYDTNVNGRLVRFTGPYGDYMPHLAVLVVDFLKPLPGSTAYIADILRGLPTTAFPPRATPYARHMRITRLLVEPVQVDDGVLALAREPRKSHWEKSARVTWTKGGSLHVRAPTPAEAVAWELPAASAAPAGLPPNVDAIVAAVLKALGHPAPTPANPAVVVAAPAPSYEMSLPPADDGPLVPKWPLIPGAPQRKPSEPMLPIEGVWYDRTMRRARAALTSANIWTENDPRIIAPWEPDVSSPFRGLLEPLSQLARLRQLDRDVLTPPADRPPRWVATPCWTEGLLWEPLPIEELRALVASATIAQNV